MESFAWVREYHFHVPNFDTKRLSWGKQYLPRCVSGRIRKLCNWGQDAGVYQFLFSKYRKPKIQNTSSKRFSFGCHAVDPSESEFNGSTHKETFRKSCLGCFVADSKKKITGGLQHPVLSDTIFQSDQQHNTECPKLLLTPSGSLQHNF